MNSGDKAGFKHKVLIVDDEALNIEFLQTLLSEEINVIFATSGEDALTIVQANRPDMILLDIMMPGMDGYEVCKRLKGNEKTKDIPVIFVTAKSGPEEEARGLELGAIDYITKPFNPEIVKSKVRNNIIRIAAPRPDLAQHHNTERRDRRQDRRASDKVNPWKWLAVVAVLMAVVFVAVSFLGGENPNLADLAGKVGISTSTQTTDAAETSRDVAPVTSNTDAQTAPIAPALTTRTPDKISQGVADVVGQSAPGSLAWVEKSQCGEIPDVSWWKFNSRLSIVRYVERNLKGNWEGYVDKWSKRRDSVADIFARSSTAITNTGVELSGEALEQYVGQLSTRLEVIRCLRVEAEKNRTK
jgi:CheY-like chemotaxis protein